MSPDHPAFTADLFEELLESAPDAMVIVDEEGRIVRLNHQAEQLFGHPRAEILGKHIEVLIPKRFHAGHVQHRDQYMNDSKPRPMGMGLELYGLRADGTEFPVEISLSPMRGGQRKLVTAAIRDVSERQRVAERERRTQAMFRALLDAAPDGMVIVDGEGEITLVNAQAERMFGRSRAQLVGQPVEVLIPDRFRSTHVGHRTKYTADPRPRPMGAGYDLFGLRADGSEFPVEISLSPMEHEGEQYVIAAVRDITQRKRLELQEAKAKEAEAEMERLRERDAFKTQFINNAAHELNTPLTPLMMQIKILELESDSLGESQRQSIETLRRNGERFSRLVQDLLDAGRYQGGRLSLRRQTIDLRHLLDSVVADHAAAFKEQDMTVAIEAPATMAAHADPDRITQVLDNLLNNALKFTPPGGQVHCRGRVDDGKTVVEVQDNGIGLSKEQQDRLFEPFSRVHDDQGGPPGTGLGLYLCRALVEMHGGDIRVESAGPGRGTTFRIELPAP